MVRAAGTAIGDVIFILFVCGVIFGIMALVNRGRKDKTKPPKSADGS